MIKLLWALFHEIYCFDFVLSSGFLDQEEFAVNPGIFCMSTPMMAMLEMPPTDIWKDFCKQRQDVRHSWTPPWSTVCSFMGRALYKQIALVWLHQCFIQCLLLVAGCIFKSNCMHFFNLDGAGSFHVCFVLSRWQMCSDFGIVRHLLLRRYANKAKMHYAGKFSNNDLCTVFALGANIAVSPPL